ncbi:tRNA (cytosine(32)/uridine(32)-2'-O)-methyltransferase TrmJ [Legionella israelensis]|uniref:tRNA (cytidine/uridine-2'-O-)-methyltransferase TrmJ n=1 Tax=Legionella israelensis TaxID=454 RepID=A0AAX1EH44_9GAMM|nr:tRNA (cytosine(32)/uridine(32)-2'-O)-methyltransferase TrmJ [Legionella israelensis]QBR84300.1 tRNA (cytosine(32)/uridine(32)-2'-O)-methyltransferase TrmJ [Legionella israelensis]
MRFDSIRIVLVETSHPGNIGSAARAMKTMGLGRLYLVNPKFFPDKRANDMAAGADDVVAQAIVTASLQEALLGCQLIVGTSARPRGIGLPGLIPADCARLVSSQPDDTEVALVFGREHAGLTNEELLSCHYHLHIPSNSEYSSLNLAQAVQIIAYEIRMKILNPMAEVELRPDKLAAAQDIERFYQHLKDVLLEIGFLKPSNPRRLMQRIKRLFNRAQLEDMEVRLLRGMLSRIQNALKYAKINNKEF